MSKGIRQFLISTISDNPNGTKFANLMNYYFNDMPSIKEIRERFVKKYPGNTNVIVMSIMEFSNDDFNKIVSEQ